MCCGLLLFGFAVGGIASLSKTPVAAGLLTSMFGFVGGVLLSFAGFTVVDAKAGGEKPRVNTLQIGVALVAFSLGLSGGVAVGLIVRFHHPGIVNDPPETTADSKSAPDGKSALERKASTDIIGLEADEQTLCANVDKEIAGKQYAADPTLAPARLKQLLKVLFDKEIAGKQYAPDPTLAPARVEQLHNALCTPTK